MINKKLNSTLNRINELQGKIISDVNLLLADKVIDQKEADKYLSIAKNIRFSGEHYSELIDKTKELETMLDEVKNIRYVKRQQEIAKKRSEIKFLVEELMNIGEDMSLKRSKEIIKSVKTLSAEEVETLYANLIREREMAHEKIDNENLLNGFLETLLKCKKQGKLTVGERLIARNKFEKALNSGDMKTVNELTEHFSKLEQMPKQEFKKRAKLGKKKMAEAKKGGIELPSWLPKGLLLGAVIATPLILASCGSLDCVCEDCMKDCGGGHHMSESSESETSTDSDYNVSEGDDQENIINDSDKGHDTESKDEDNDHLNDLDGNHSHGDDNNKKPSNGDTSKEEVIGQDQTDGKGEQEVPNNGVTGGNVKPGGENDFVNPDESEAEATGDYFVEEGIGTEGTIGGGSSGTKDENVPGTGTIYTEGEANETPETSTPEVSTPTEDQVAPDQEGHGDYQKYVDNVMLIDSWVSQSLVLQEGKIRDVRVLGFSSVDGPYNINGQANQVMINARVYNVKSMKEEYVSFNMDVEQWNLICKGSGTNTPNREKLTDAVVSGAYYFNDYFNEMG